MANIIDNILTRKSIRNFTNRQVPEEIIHNILQAGMSAPSACNQQPWQFKVISNRNILDELSRMHSGTKMLETATLAIVVYGLVDNLILDRFWPQDCAASTMNILLSAHSLGLGAVWSGVYPYEDNVNKVNSILGEYENLIPFSLIPIGFPNEDHEIKSRFDINRVHFIR